MFFKQKHTEILPIWAADLHCDMNSSPVVFDITSSAEPMHLYASQILKTESLLEHWECLVPDAISCTKPRADTAPAMWFNTAYFRRHSVGTHGQQNSNQLGTVGLYIPVFWGCFLTRAAWAGESYPLNPARARDANTWRGPSLRNTCVGLYLILWKPFYFFFFLRLKCCDTLPPLWSHC